MVKALEKLVGKNALAEEYAESMGFGIDPSFEAYWGSDEDREKSFRKKFVGKAQSVFDLKEYFEKVEEKQGNVDAVNDLSNLIIGQVFGRRKPKNKEEAKKLAEEIEQARASLRRQPSEALRIADGMLSEGLKYLAVFVENNRDAILDRFTAEQTYTWFSSMQLYKNGNKEHDRIVELRDKLTKIQQASQKQQDPSAVLKKEVKELVSKIPEEQKQFLKACPSMGSSLTTSISSLYEVAYNNAFRNPKTGEINQYEVRTYIEDNLGVVEKLMNDTDRPLGERAKRWEDNSKGAYTVAGEILYKSEKPIAKRDKDEDKEDRIAKDKKVGLRT